MKRFVALVFSVLLVFDLAATHAKASPVTYDLSGVFNGATPTSSPPWLTVAFEDITEGVQVTIASSLETASEFIGQVGFDVLGGGTATLQGAFKALPGSTFTLPSIAYNTAMQGTGNTTYDVLLSFSNAPPGARFDGTADVVQFVLGSGLTVDANFSGLDFGEIAAHIQGIPLNGGTTSGAVTGTGTGTPAVPIPAAGWLLGSGLLGLVGISRRLRSRKK
jgi:hypothetical protein